MLNKILIILFSLSLIIGCGKLGGGDDDDDKKVSYAPYSGTDRPLATLSVQYYHYDPYNNNSIRGVGQIISSYQTARCNEDHNGNPIIYPGSNQHCYRFVISGKKCNELMIVDESEFGANPIYPPGSFYPGPSSSPHNCMTPWMTISMQSNQLRLRAKFRGYQQYDGNDHYSWIYTHPITISRRQPTNPN